MARNLHSNINIAKKHTHSDNDSNLIDKQSLTQQQNKQY